MTVPIDAFADGADYLAVTPILERAARRQVWSVEVPERIQVREVSTIQNWRHRRGVSGVAASAARIGGHHVLTACHLLRRARHSDGRHWVGVLRGPDAQQIGVQS